MVDVSYVWKTENTIVPISNEIFHSRFSFEIFDSKYLIRDLLLEKNERLQTHYYLDLTLLDLYLNLHRPTQYKVVNEGQSDTSWIRAAVKLISSINIYLIGLQWNHYHYCLSQTNNFTSFRHWIYYTISTRMVNFHYEISFIRRMFYDNKIGIAFILASLSTVWIIDIGVILVFTYIFISKSNFWI